MEGDGGRWRAKLYKLLPDGGWDAQGVGLVQLVEEEGIMSLVMHEEDDEDRLIIRTKIAAENSYTEQENTIITWTESSTGTELALSFQGHEGKDHVWASLQAYKQRLLMDSGAAPDSSSNAPSANPSSASGDGAMSHGDEGEHDGSPNGSLSESPSLSGTVAYGRRAGSFLEPASDSECDDDDFRMYGTSDFGAPKEIPKPEAGLDSLQSLLQIVEEAVNSIMDREPLTNTVTQDNSAWLQQLGKVFAAAEQSSQHAQCEVVHNIMRQLALASTRQLLSTLTSDRFWPLLVAAFEYDHSSAAAASSVARAGTPAPEQGSDAAQRSSTPMPHQQSDSSSLPGTPVVPLSAPPTGSQAAAPAPIALPATAAFGAPTPGIQSAFTHSAGASAAVRPHHRRFLRNIKFRTAVPLEDEEMVQTIHQTFRLQFLRDVLLPCALDHSFVSTVTSMISENHMMLVAHFAQDDQYIARLLTVLHDSKQRDKRRLSILTKAVHRSRRQGGGRHHHARSDKEKPAAPTSKPTSPSAGPLPVLSTSGAAAVTPEPASTAASVATPGSGHSVPSVDSAMTQSPSSRDRISARVQSAAPASPTYPVQQQHPVSSSGMLPSSSASLTPALITTTTAATAAIAPEIDTPQRPTAVDTSAGDDVVLPATATSTKPVTADADADADAQAVDTSIPTDTAAVDEPNTQPSSDTVPLSAPGGNSIAAGDANGAGAVTDPLEGVQLPPLSSVQPPPPPASYDARDAMKFLKEISQAALKHATMGDRRDLFARLLQPVERNGRELFLLDVFAPVLADRTAGVEEVQTALDVLIAIVDAEPDTVRAYMLRQNESLHHVPPKLGETPATDVSADGAMASVPRLSSSQLREVRQGEHGHLLPLLDDDLASSKVPLDAEGRPPAGCSYSNVSLLYCLVWRLLEDPDVGVQGLAADAVKSLWDPDRLPSGELHDFLSMFYDHYMPLLLRPLTHPELAPIPTVPQSSHLLSLMRRTGASHAGQSAGRPLRRPRPIRPIVVDTPVTAAPAADTASDTGPMRVSSNAATVGAPDEGEAAGGVTGGIKRARSFESEGIPELVDSKPQSPGTSGAAGSPQKRARHSEDEEKAAATPTATPPATTAAGQPVQVQVQPLPSTAGSTASVDKPEAQHSGSAAPRTSGLSLADMQQAAGRLGQESACSKHSKLLLCGLLAFALEHHTHRIKYFLVRQNVAVQVMRLAYYPERHMQLAGIRFLRAVMGGNDAFYHRYMARLSLFGHVFWALAANGSMSNLVNSAVLESLHFVAQENVEILIKDLTNKYGTVLREISYSRAPAAILRKARQLARGQQLTAAVSAGLGDYGMESDGDSEDVQPKQGTAAAMRASRGTALSSGDSLGSSGIGGGSALFGRRSLLSRSALNRPALGAGRPSFDDDDDEDSDLVGGAGEGSGQDDDSDGGSTPILEDGADLMADLENASPATAAGGSSLPSVPDAQMAAMLSAALKSDAEEDDEDGDTPFGLSTLTKPKAKLAAVPKSAPSALAVQSIFSQVSSAASSTSATTPSNGTSNVSSAVTSGIMSGPQISISLGSGTAATSPSGSAAPALVDYGPEAE